MTAVDITYAPQKTTAFICPFIAEQMFTIHGPITGGYAVYMRT